jgi:16S rRNA processing protein RimM
MTDAPAKRVLLGQIGAAHGLRGEVRIQSYTAAPEDIAAYGPLESEDGARVFHILRVKPGKGEAVIATLKGVADRTGAEALRGSKLYAPRERLPPVEQDEYYHADLIGLTAVSPSGEQVGEVVAVQNYGAGDLLEIRLTATAKTELIPFTSEFAPSVDIQRGAVIVIMPSAEEAG